MRSGCKCYQIFQERLAPTFVGIFPIKSKKSYVDRKLTIKNYKKVAIRSRSLQMLLNIAMFCAI